MELRFKCVNRLSFHILIISIFTCKDTGNQTTKILPFVFANIRRFILNKNGRDSDHLQRSLGSHTQEDNSGVKATG